MSETAEFVHSAQRMHSARYAPIRLGDMFSMFDPDMEELSMVQDITRSPHDY